jgi:hypothetical protein
MGQKYLIKFVIQLSIVCCQENVEPILFDYVNFAILQPDVRVS